ncbi:PAS domain-containing protein [Mesobacterium pallidum]|uniref:PAS domain-containing protein n=1 Tax=Mesobacterium pallidum TaxID=2872037 RepID=UPI001EE2D87A|nr:PAS domain-containing protein [Mesobacterium pallidum]
MSESKKSGEAFSENEMRFDPDVRCVVICSAESGNPVTSVTETFYRYTGYTPGEVIGRSLSMLHGPDTSPEAVDMFRYLIHSGESGKVKILNYAKDGTPFWHHCEIRPISNGSGELTHFICVQRPESLD